MPHSGMGNTYFAAMSRGLGGVQRACLDVIAAYEADYKATRRLPTTYTVTADVYRVKRDKDGNRWVSDAQHSAVKRALSGLQRHGRIMGMHKMDHGRKVGRDLYWVTMEGAQSFGLVEAPKQKKQRQRAKRRV